MFCLGSHEWDSNQWERTLFWFLWHKLCSRNREITHYKMVHFRWSHLVQSYTKSSIGSEAMKLTWIISCRNIGKYLLSISIGCKWHYHRLRKLSYVTDVCSLRSMIIPGFTLISDSQTQPMDKWWEVKFIRFVSYVFRFRICQLALRFPLCLGRSVKFQSDTIF